MYRRILETALIATLLVVFTEYWFVSQPNDYKINSDYTEKMEDETIVEKALDFLSVCPIGSTIVLLYPHVNKAGGRTIEATFSSLVKSKEEPRHRYMSLMRRSNTHSFGLIDHHKSLPLIAMERDCFNYKDSIRACETTSKDICYRWAFTLRDPVARFISAFYTSTGRPGPLPRGKNPIYGSTGASEGHFICKKGSKAWHRMQDINFSIEEWASLPMKDRQACSYTHNLHVKYLAADAPDGSEEQYLLALQRLKQVSWFGLVSRWSESMELLSRTFGADLTHYVSVSNLNVYNKTISEKTLRVIENANLLDIRLYHAATEIFNERMAQLGSKTPFVFICNRSDQICWDKSSFNGPFWISDDKKRFPNAGKQKELMLCAPRDGCLLSQAPKPPPASLCLASVFIIGARKGGTTSLYQYLSKHPKFHGINLLDDEQAGELLVKEGTFLESLKEMKNPADFRRNYDEVFKKHIASEQVVEKIRQGHVLTGESSVGNGPACSVASQLVQGCGTQIRMIYMVRNPINRIVSQYLMRSRLDSSMKKSVEEFVLEDLREIQIRISKKPKNSCLFEHDHLNSIWSSMYIVHLNRWLESYPRNQLLLLKSEDFFANPVEGLKQTLDFVGLEPSIDLNEITKTRFNGSPPSASKQELSNQTLTLLQTFFAPYNHALSKAFNISITDWV